MLDSEILPVGSHVQFRGFKKKNSGIVKEKRVFKGTNFVVIETENGIFWFYPDGPLALNEGMVIWWNDDKTFRDLERVKIFRKEGLK